MHICNDIVVQSYMYIVVTIHECAQRAERKMCEVGKKVSTFYFFKKMGSRNEHRSTICAFIIRCRVNLLALELRRVILILTTPNSFTPAQAIDTYLRSNGTTRIIY